MQGFHKVKKFYLKPADLEKELPAGWKPFSSYTIGATVVLVCRKWEKLEEVS